jgi:HTH-type transcriptional regulator/antitoxin HigA
MSPRAFPAALANRLAAVGVGLVLQPHFPKTYAYGATFWLGAEKAVLVLSLRGRWADVFWFSLFHEIGHLLLHRKTTFIDDGDVPADGAELEREAERFAEETLIPSAELFAFVGKGDLRAPAVKAFAEGMGIAAGVVVGRLQHEGAVSLDSGLNRLRQRYEWEEQTQHDA